MQDNSSVSGMRRRRSRAPTDGLNCARMLAQLYYAHWYCIWRFEHGAGWPGPGSPANSATQRQ